MFRYIALAFDEQDASSASVAQHIAERVLQLAGGWKCVFKIGPLHVYAAEPSAVCGALVGQTGLILGCAFHTQRRRDSSRADPPVRADPLTVEFLLSGGPQRLVSDIWGNYIGLRALEQERHVWILKAPTGELPCIHLTHGAVHLLASHVADLRAIAPHRLRGNLSYLRRRMCWLNYGTRSAAIQGLTALVGGECLELDFRRSPPALTARQHWRPSEFCKKERLIADNQHALHPLRNTIDSCTHSLTLGHARLLHRLSGGLDSSIVLASLAHTAAAGSVTAYTYFQPESRADERPWARLASAHARIRHLEQAFRPETIDLRGLEDLAAAPQPLAALSYLQRAPFERELCAELGSDVVFCGDGGDSGFCRDSISFIAADYVREQGVRPRLLAICAAIARHTGQSAWEVLGDAWSSLRYVSNGSVPAQIIARLSTLVAAELVAASEKEYAPPHPWFNSDVPASAMRRLGVLAEGSDFYDFSVPPHIDAPQIAAPLLAQPVVELCLRIPSYVHFAQGRERGLVRAAFAQRLPAAVVHRYWKDRAPGFLDAVLERNREFVRSFLLEGILMREGLLLRPALERALSPAASAHQVTTIEIFNHLNTEAWARHWFN